MATCARTRPRRTSKIETLRRCQYQDCNPGVDHTDAGQRSTALEPRGGGSSTRSSLLALLTRVLVPYVPSENPCLAGILRRFGTSLSPGVVRSRLLPPVLMALLD